MFAFFVSTGIVALAEMGDKTQLLAFLLAAKFRRPTPIILGILVATLLNHALAGALGLWLHSLFSAELLRWILGGSFIMMAMWMLIPDKIDEDSAKLAPYGVFATTVMAFFLAEMGDKTQIATIALAAQYPSLFAVVAGTTLGMMLANVPAVLLGNQIALRLPMRLFHSIAAAIFAGLGVAILSGLGKHFGI
jgi:putative Ca2+/H+ antiporter (TMEM165/GDT1 family)